MARLRWTHQAFDDIEAICRFITCDSEHLVLPNIAAPVIIIFGIDMGGVIFSEASLSFLGFGLPVEIPSWGGLLSREGRRYMEMAPHLAFWPSLALTFTVYSLNMFDDAVRDLLDPRLRYAVGRYGDTTKKEKMIMMAKVKTGVGQGKAQNP